MVRSQRTGCAVSERKRYKFSGKLTLNFENVEFWTGLTEEADIAEEFAAGVALEDLLDGATFPRVEVDDFEEVKS